MQPNISNYSRDRQFKGSRAGGKIQYSKGALNFHIFKLLKHQSKSVLTYPGVSSLTALSLSPCHHLHQNQAILQYKFGQRVN